MTFTDYLINLGLVGLVVLQLRGRKLTVRDMILPLAVVAVVGSQFLKAIPTAGNDVLLESAGALAGLALGSLAGLATSVRPDASGDAFAKAGVVAAVLWVAGIGSRVGFSLWVQHFGGSGPVSHFSVAHAITSSRAWGVGFTLMALAEVVSRTGTIYLKARRSGGAIVNNTRFLGAARAA